MLSVPIVYGGIEGIYGDPLVPAMGPVIVRILEDGRDSIGRYTRLSYIHPIGGAGRHDMIKTFSSKTKILTKSNLIGKVKFQRISSWPCDNL